MWKWLILGKSRLCWEGRGAQARDDAPSHFCLCQTGVSGSVVSDSLQPHGLQPLRLLYPWDSPDKNTGVGCHFLLRGNLPDPGIKPRSPILQADSLPSELPGKPMKDRKGLKLEGEGGRLGKGRCWSRKQHQLCFFPWKPCGAFKPLRAPQGPADHGDSSGYASFWCLEGRRGEGRHPIQLFGASSHWIIITSLQGGLSRTHQWAWPCGPVQGESRGIFVQGGCRECSQEYNLGEPSQSETGVVWPSSKKKEKTGWSRGRVESVAPWTVARQAPLPMGSSRQEFWGGLPFPSPGDLPDPGIKPRSPALQADCLPTKLWGKLLELKLGTEDLVSRTLGGVRRESVSTETLPKTFLIVCWFGEMSFFRNVSHAPHPTPKKRLRRLQTIFFLQTHQPIEWFEKSYNK